MKKDNFTKKELIDLLIKKAKGFYYSEEQCEYEKKSPTKTLEDFNNKNSELEKNANLSFFDENIAEKSQFDNNFNEEKKFSKNLKKVGRVCSKTRDCGDIMEVSNETEIEKLENLNLSLIKKKISTHFVPPDMIAIKILFEIYDKKVDDSEIENMSDDELIKLKNKLLEELKNDDNQN